MSLSAARMVRLQQGSRLEFTGDNGLDAGEIAYPGGLACVDTSSGAIVPGQTSTTLVPIGLFAGPETTDNSAGSDPVPITVNLLKDHVFVWMVNDDTNAVVATDLLKDCYVVDDQTVSISSATSTRSVAGKVWGVSASKGVLVELVTS